MPAPKKPTTQDILAKYARKIESQISNSNQTPKISQEYERFRQDMLPEISHYKRWAQTLGNLVRVKLSPKEENKMQKYLNIAHISVTPSQAMTLSIFSMLLIFFLVLILSISIFLITNTLPLLLAFLGLITSLFVFYYTYTMPQRLANAWRLKASSQMVPAILYIVVYMRHTSNLERAIAFASQHLEAPLSFDFKKIFYDVEIGKFSTIKQSIDHYLETWQDYSPEFVEAVHLIESSLYEPSEARRVQILDKSLEVILDGVYQNLLRYSRSIRSPLTNIYMLGIILPTLGLALLPLASTLLGGILKASHVFVIFNVIIPFFVFYMTSEVLLKRPGGYGEASTIERNPNYYKFLSRKPWFIGFILAVPFAILALLPFIFQLDLPINIQNDYTLGQLGIKFFEDIELFGFKTLSDNSKAGPFSPIAMILSLFLPLSLVILFATAYKLKTKDLIISRDQTKVLEQEFANSIFQLGNRIGDGTPAELAFSKVASSTQGQKTQKFFSIVSQNIQQFGLSVESAIFDRGRGAIISFPSSLVATSMSIFVESVKKGLQVAARSLMSISEYVKNIQRINERLRDLLAEIVSDMKSNMVFLAPLLAGIIVGLSSMITLVLVKLQTLTESGISSDQIAGFGSVANIASIFDVTAMISPYFIQIAVGIYLVEITFILTKALVTIDAGNDILQEKNQLAKNLKKGITVYFITSLFSIIALAILATVALGGLV